MLMGQFHYAIDSKGRLNFPARFREELGDRIVVTRWLDHCLVVFSIREFEQVADTLAQKGMAQSRDIQRLLFSFAEEIRPDKQGRILLNAELRSHAKLTKEVTVIGNRNHAEIWDSAAWEEYNRRLAENSDQLAEAMSALGL